MPCKDFRLFCNKCAELVVPWRKWARRGIAIAALVRGHFELSFRGDISFQFVSWLPMIIIHLNYQLVRNYSKICNLQLNKVIKNISIYLIDVYIFFIFSHVVDLSKCLHGVFGNPKWKLVFFFNFRICKKLHICSYLLIIFPRFVNPLNNC